MAKVIIYSTPTCPYCNIAKDFFNEHNIDYTDYDVTEDFKAKQEMIQKSNQLGVPVIDIDGEIIVGFDEARLRKLLGIK